MHVTFATSLALVAAVASALPGPFDIRAELVACNADNCLRAVRAASATPGAASASADCASFFATTVVPCPATTTSTVTSVVTGSESTTTVSQTQTAVATETDIDTVTATTTIYDTATATTPQAVPVTSTVTVPVTVTAAPKAKRAVEARQDSGSTCPASTQTASSVPYYASACSGTSRYSSACSCNGATATTTTAAQQTSTVYTTTTSTYTPTVTATAVGTVTTTTTVHQTTTAQATVETTATTVFVASSYTTVQTVTVSSTVTVAPPAPTCTKFLIKSTSGPTNGSFVANVATTGQFVPQALAQVFTLRPDGALTQPGTNVVAFGLGRSSTVQIADQAIPAAAGNPVLKCAVANPYGVSSFGKLSCSTVNGPTTFSQCVPSGSFVIQSVGSAGVLCQDAGLVAIPACS